MIRIPGVCPVVPASVLLAISFFVMFARERAQDKKLKVFGLAVAIVLWFAVFSVVSFGVLSLFKTSKCFKGGLCGLNPCGKAGYSEPVDPYHNFESDPHHWFLADPHRAMREMQSDDSMKYHQYDDQGNIILDNTTRPDAP